MKSYFAFLLPLILAGCEFHEERANPRISVGLAGKPVATYSWIHKNILAKQCLECHKTGGDDEDAANFSTHGEALKSIDLENPEASKLYKSVTRAKRWMPKGGSKLSDPVIAAILTWIKKGAKDD